ncbi:chemotaxis protein CheA [Wenxinia marina]|uniref:Chemotaxis protein CheA n=1 Tax=Wenxinia marina DSM 24838 TaxID=1123501 RepID=A0A0D0P747_9RHOB|nr:chemotaxis protein CheA [Wenxinia marina]KIQ67406.1 Chemotaxis protein histidine kinase [Wenxinia marina DSM 24838]GGL69737.1 chemotaxis protein CheA [Wenxinia marina]
MSDSLRDMFFAECEDLLEALSEGLAAMSDGTHDAETVNAIFRAVHSIKGAAGAFALEDIVSFAHQYETVLDLIRSGQLDPDAEVMRAILRSSDVLADLVDAAQNDRTDRPDAMAPLLEQLTRLADAAPAPIATQPPEPEAVFAPMAAMPLTLAPIVGAESRFRIRFRPERALFDNGHDPLRLLRALSALGELTVDCDLSAIPPLGSFDPEESFLAWDMTLTGDIAEGEIRGVFSFVDGLCTLSVEREDDEAPQSTVPNSPLPQPAATPPGEAETPLVNADPPPDPGGERQPVRAGGAAAANAGPARPTLRVDPERVDRLINTVGELIINQAVIGQKIAALGAEPNSEVMSDLDDYRHLARDIQEGVMAIRAQPVKPLFQRMGRIIREAAEAVGKEVVLETEGEMTEVDKTVVERLADPLTHMVRNAVDHGIEPAALRTERGKPAEGTVRLIAAHRSGHVHIAIADDGGGLDRERILGKAVEKGLVSPEAKLTESEIDNLLFLPGFSTASSITNLSGRGVGMDVVKTAITSLGGRVSISSRPGHGSTFSITLPLTLAVLDGMVVTVGDQTMVLPLYSILETIRPQARNVTPLGRGGHVLSIRGAYVPIVSLAHVLGLASEPFDPTRSIFVLIRADGSQPVALAVEAISDQRQVVIKSLEGNYGRIPGISAATILGDGKIALIVDTDTVVAIAAQTPAVQTIRDKEPDHEQLAALG